MNIGRAASSQELLESQNAENRFLPQIRGGWLVKSAMPIQPTIASVMAIHTPPARNSNITNSRKPPISTTPMGSFSRHAH